MILSGRRRLASTRPKRVRGGRGSEYCEGENGGFLSIHLTRQFEEAGGYEEIVLLKDIPFQSHCEHHMAPITGKAAIGYLPNKKVVGISKLARVLHGFAHRLQIQERLDRRSGPVSSGTISTRRALPVVIEAQHGCMTRARGKTPRGESKLVTSRIPSALLPRRSSSRKEVMSLMGY